MNVDDDIPELEECRFCGHRLEFPCETPPPDICEQAINKKEPTV